MAVLIGPVFRAGPAADRPRLQERPGLYGPLRDWRLLAGPEHRPRQREWEPAERSIAAWLELQFWWRQAFRASPRPVGPGKPISRICASSSWRSPRGSCSGSSTARGSSRGRKLLERALRLMPEEEASLRMALATLERLPDVVEPPLEDALRSLVRQSSRVEVLSQVRSRSRPRWTAEGARRFGSESRGTAIARRDGARAAAAAADRLARPRGAVSVRARRDLRAPSRATRQSRARSAAGGRGRVGRARTPPCARTSLLVAGLQRLGARPPARGAVCGHRSGLVRAAGGPGRRRVPERSGMVRPGLGGAGRRRASGLARRRRPDEPERGRGAGAALGRGYARPSSGRALEEREPALPLDARRRGASARRERPGNTLARRTGVRRVRGLPASAERAPAAATVAALRAEVLRLPAYGARRLGSSGWIARLV